MRSSEVCHPVREAAELPVRIPKLRVAGSNPVSHSNPSCGPTSLDSLGIDDAALRLGTTTFKAGALPFRAQPRGRP